MEGTKLSCKELFSKLTLNEFVILSFVASTFISVYLQAALILLLPIYAVVSKQWKLFLPAKKSGYLLLAFAFSAAISTFLFSKDGLVFSFEVKSWYLKLLAIGIVILVFDIFFFSNIMTQRAFHLGLKLTSLLSISSFLIVVYQRIFEIYPDPIQRPGRVASVFMNENYYGMVIEFAALTSLFLFFQVKDVKKKLLYGVAFASNVLGLWLCQSRMAYIIVALSVLLFLFYNHKKLSYVVLICLAGLLLLLIKYPDILPRFDTIGSYLDFRLGIWSAAITAFCKNPLLGFGYYSYSAIWRENPDSWQFQALHTHNLYIEVMTNFGVIGAMLLLAFVLICIIECVKACKSSHNKGGFVLILTAVIAVAVHGLADTTIFWPQTGFFAVFLLTCSHVYLSKESNKGEQN